MIDYRQLPPPPEFAAENSYDVFTQLFPQRHAAWAQLAEWERERWRIIAASARADHPCPVCTGEIPAGLVCGDCGRRGPQ